MNTEHKMKLFLENDNIKNILMQVLDKADKIPFSKRKQRISFPVNEEYFPDLFAPKNFGEDELLEEAISSLCNYGIFKLVSPATKKHLPLIQRNAKLIFNEVFEEKIRVFYSRPVKDDKWKKALEAYPFMSNKARNLLFSRPIFIPTKAPEDIIQRFDDWATQGKRMGTIRQESARCFWGLSKIFDNRDDIASAFQLKETPVMLNVYAFSEEVNKVLFIENLDTFIAAIDSNNPIFSDMVIIYSSGYKASAKRIRSRDGSRMFFEFDCHFSDVGRESFLAWFYQEESKNTESCFFWGDLDYSGIGILIALREKFPDITTWELGYRQMVELQESDFGHTPEMAKKENQIQIYKETDIAYVDGILLHALNKHKTFVDQEIVNLEKI